MAIVEVKVPQLSESVAEATLLQWKKKAGEAVAIDEILIEIETDKVVLEVPAPAAGVLAEIVHGRWRHRDGRAGDREDRYRRQGRRGRARRGRRGTGRRSRRRCRRRAGCRRLEGRHRDACRRQAAWPTTSWPPARCPAPARTAA